MTRVTVRVLRGIEAVEAKRETWEAFPSISLAADLDYFLTVARSHAEVVRPHVLVAERGGEPVSLLAAYVRHGWITHRLGPWTPYRPTVRAITSAYRGLLGERSQAVADAFVRSLRDSLLAREAEAVHLRYVLDDDPLAAVVPTAFAGLRRERCVPRRSHWAITLGDSLDDTLAACSPSTREGLRRTARRFERVYAGRMRLDVHDTPDAAQELFAAVDHVATRSYQSHGKGVFGASGLERELAMLGLERGWYRAYVLTADDVPIAFWTGYAYAGSFGWRGATGYDPAYARHSPGTYLMLRLIADLAQDPDVTSFDLGGGDIDYKRRLADRRWDELDIRCFGPGLRPARIGATGTSVHAVHQALRGVATAASVNRTPTRLRRRWLKRRARWAPPLG